MRLIDVPMVENDVNAKTVGEYLKMLLLYLWAEAEQFNSKRPFGNGGWQYDVYVSLIKAGYEIGELDEDGDLQEVDYAKADKLITEAIDAEFAELEPIVRCKDCLHCTPVEGGKPLCTLHNIGRVYNDFCSDGKKKTVGCKHKTPENWCDNYVCPSYHDRCGWLTEDCPFFER